MMGAAGGGGSRSSSSSRTRATPRRIMPNWRAAAYDRSISRPGKNGPRSVIRTTTERPVRSSVTFTVLPRLIVRCAAVSRWGLNTPPPAVGFPWKLFPYHDARVILVDVTLLRRAPRACAGAATATADNATATSSMAALRPLRRETPLRAMYPSVLTSWRGTPRGTHRTWRQGLQPWLLSLKAGEVS